MSGASQSEFQAIVTNIREESRIHGRVRWQVTLDTTRFQEGDRGHLLAIAKSGARLEIPVLATHVDSAGEIWHTIEKPLASETPITGFVVSCE